MQEIFKILAKEPMPKWDGEEPCELDMKRIRRYHDDGRFNELPRKDQDWVVYRLIPSLVRYGCYPPPPEQNIKFRKDTADANLSIRISAKIKAQVKNLIRK